MMPDSIKENQVRPTCRACGAPVSKKLGVFQRELGNAVLGDALSQLQAAD